MVFLAVLAPYLINSERTFGQSFYNVNTTFYAWYNNWASASTGTLAHGDGVGWPRLPADQIPSPAKYWRTHTLGEIAARVGSGFEDMLVRSYSTYWYLKYVVWYGLLLVAVVLSGRRVFVNIVRTHAPLAVFMALYAVSHLVLVAFYHPISGTGTTRFLITFLTPFFYTASRYLAHPAVASTRWTIATVPFGLPHLHALTAAMLGLDIAFAIWPRLMTTYGGF